MASFKIGARRCRSRVWALTFCALAGGVALRPEPLVYGQVTVGDQSPDGAAQAVDPGQSAPAETPQAPAKTYPVRGVVLSSLTHQPIARVLVNGQQDAALTDSEGRFELQLPAGTLVLQVQKPGYNTGREMSPLVVDVGPDKPEITVDLRPDALITGQVTFSNSDTADGVRVRVSRRTAVNGRIRWVTYQMVTTNSEGNFRVAGLAPGIYMVSTEMERDQDGGQEGFGYPVVYYPGVADPGAAGLITLTTGQHVQADFLLTRQKFYPVVATVAGGKGGGSFLQIHDATGRDAGGGVRPDPLTGIARLSAPNGSYYIEARSFDMSVGPRAGSYGRADFRVAGAPVTDLNLTLLPLHGIAVNVRKQFSSANRAGGGVISSIRDGDDGGAANAGLTLMLSAATDEFGEENNQGGNLVRVRSANDEGAFELTPVAQGTYWLTVFPFQGYVSSITCGGADLSREPLVVGPGSTASPIEVTLRDDTGTINGRVVRQGAAGNGAGTGVPGSTATTSYASGQAEYYIYAIPLFPSSGQLMGTQASPSGDFAFGNLAPGAYRVVVFDTPQEIDFHSAEGLARYSSVGQVVTIEAGGEAKVQLDAPPVTNEEPQ
ncbi:MAG TPA: carboxypeptidase regulatory-like domain-containing protein [Acidisarcina sp.]